MLPLEPQLVEKTPAAMINPREMAKDWRGDEEAKRIKPSGWHFEGTAYILTDCLRWPDS
jgi:hypothetical protein